MKSWEEPTEENEGAKINREVEISEDFSENSIRKKDVSLER